jgi:enamine deaminase RidA (YjgF/YER057c/UK114 family)
MNKPEERLKELGIELPSAPGPLGSYVPASRSGNLLFISGMLPLKDGKLTRTGKVGKDLSIDEGREQARISALNALSVLREHAGSLDHVVRCIKLTGFISSTPGFNEQPSVLNGASDLMAEVFGETGKHARAAVGVSELPMDSPVEVEFIFELKPY